MGSRGPVRPVSAASDPPGGRAKPAEPPTPAAPAKPAEPAEVQELIVEERQHLKKAVRLADLNPTSVIALDAEAHAERQVDRAVTIDHYEQILDAALRNFDLELLLPEILGRIRSMLEVDEATVFLLDEAGRHLYARASVGMEEAVEAGIRIPVGQDIAGAVITSRQSATLYDISAATVANPMLLAKGFQSLVGVPILVDDAAIGVLTAGCIERRVFEPHEVRLLEVVADRVGLAIERARVLRQALTERDRAERASKLKTTLLHMASHDIKTPLTAIRLQLDLLKDPGLPPGEQAKALSVADRSVTRLGLILDDFLDLAQIEAGRLTLRVAKVDLHALAEDVVEMFAPQAALKGVELRLAGQPMVLEGDERRITQVLVNLVSNAIRYTPRGSIWLKVRRAEGAAHLVVEAAELVVLDTGRGMTKDQIERLFEPFGQVHQGATEGTGLGLHLSKVIVEAHGGKIRVESPGENQGTAVIVELPMHAPPSA